jgi:ubiquinol oxidase
MTLTTLDRETLRSVQEETERTPRRRYGVPARILFRLLDLFYGHARTLPKFLVLELIARVPYQSWEQVAYVAITHTYERTDLAERIQDRVLEARSQQDNEQWHLLILEERIARQRISLGRLRYQVIPQVAAFAYYQLSWLLYVIRPTWSYRLNADFEDHAEHEYMAIVAEHPEWETESFASDLHSPYDALDTFADVLRQIGHDERIHKQESEARMSEARFR